MGNIYDYINNIHIYGKRHGGGVIGILSNQGANPQAPFYDDLYIQELDTGADTFQFSTVSNKYTQDLLEIGTVIGFHYNKRYEYFTITSIEYSHYEGYKTISVYAEGIGFELLDVFMERPPIKEYPGRDNDNDGDDQYDDEYADPDDIYIDENGNIIYDKNGSGPPKKEDVTIDGNGNIIYKPNKKNEKNDTLEFKNISYPTFLNILLKNTGWKIVCQPGLESVKHDISVRYDTNIYAILQDSMQAFRGVELEFVHEGISKKASEVGETYENPVYKVVKAYKDGGRGSFVGKRFEYGRNVSGITKTQEVSQNKEDSVIYIDNIGVDVYYDINFALKSTEIPEIEIGDTHYVIDNDFCPPMTIKARIGRIEVSFSDPTKNKITIANTKKIMGAVVDEDDINETVKNIDTTISDTITDDYIYDIVDGTITDDYLSDYATMTYVDDAIEAAQFGGDCDLGKYIEIVDETHSWDTPGMGVELHVRRKTFFDGPIILTGAWADEMGVASIYYRSISGVSTIEAETVDTNLIKNATDNSINFSNSINFTECGVAGGVNRSSIYGVSELECCVIRHTYGAGRITIDGDLEVTGNIISAGGSTTSTASVESLQEEVRMRDEQIASLEARLAAIEEMLNNK